MAGEESRSQEQEREAAREARGEERKEMNDRYFIRNRRMEACRWSGDACLSITVNSGYGDHRPFIAFIFWRLWVLFRLPKWVIHPRRRKVQAKTWDAATVAHMGRDWYWDETRREFGISVSLRDLSLKYGVQPDCWPGDKSLMWLFPWMKLRYMGQRWYDLDGKLCEALSDKDENEYHGKTGRYAYEMKEEIEARVPKAIFELEDFDGERIRATTHIEEREYHRGDGWFKWLAWFLPANVHRSLDISFDNEVGREKGSWKGGTVGHSIDLQPGELHEAAFRRYCEQGMSSKHGTSPMTFIGPA
jgi:hypothetical protein